MGGNVSIIKQGKEYKAQKIPLKEVGLRNFQNDFKKAFKKLNQLFKKKYGYFIWDNTKIIDNGFVFNGSTSFLMDDKNIDIEDELLSLKPSAGDIDITVPKEIKEDLWNFLKSIEEKQITSKIRYLGNNKETISSIGEQINALFEYCYQKNKCILVQIDFEFVPYKNGSVDIFAKFGHSSTLDDLRKGIKGVASKYLLRAISYAVSQINPENVLFVTSTANCDNWEKKISKTKNPDNHVLKFSITKGLRVAYEPLICNGKFVYKDGKQVYKNLKTSESIYNTNLSDIFKALFGKEPTQEELNDFWSFVGLVKLIKKYLNKKQVEFIFERLLELLWENKNGKNIAQELDRDSSEEDAKVKFAMVNYLLKEFPFLQKIFDKWQNKIEQYYKQYGQRRSILKEILNAIDKEKNKFVIEKSLLKNVIKKVRREKELDEAQNYIKKYHLDNLIDSTNILENNFSKSLKDKIVSIIKNISNISILNDIIILLSKDLFINKINQYFLEKSIDVDTKKQFTSIFFEVQGTFEEKNDFLDVLLKTGILNGKKILQNNKSVDKLSDEKYFLFINDFTIKLYNELKNWKPGLGTKSGVGKMEGLLTVFIKDAKKAKQGDLEWNNKKVEIKANSKGSGASGGRLLGTTKAWGSTTKTWERILKKLQELNLIDNISDVDPDKLNFAKKTINNWNKILKPDRKKVIQFFTWLIRDLYPNANNQQLFWIKNCIDKDGKLTPNFLNEFAIFQFKYYKNEEKFDCIFFFNIETDDFIVVYDSDTYRKLIESRTIIFGNFNWKQNRNLAFQVGIRGQ